MGATQINYPTTDQDYIIFLKTFDQSFTLELNEQAMLTVTCEDVADFSKILEIDFDEKKSNKLVQALAILLEKEGKQLEEIYKSIEEEEED